MKTPKEWMYEKYPMIAKSLEKQTQRNRVELLMEEYAFYFAEEMEKPNEQVPTCPNDGKECTHDMDGYIRCRECERFKKEVKPVNKEENENK